MPESKVAILVGAGALHATDEVIAVADALGAGARVCSKRRSRIAMHSMSWTLGGPCNEPYEISDGRDSRPRRFRPWMSPYGMPKRSS